MGDLILVRHLGFAIAFSVGWRLPQRRHIVNVSSVLSGKISLTQENQKKHLQISLHFPFRGVTKLVLRSPLYFYFQSILWILHDMAIILLEYNSSSLLYDTLSTHCPILFTSWLVLGIFRLDPSYLFYSFGPTSQVVVVVNSLGDVGFIFRPSFAFIMYV